MKVLMAMSVALVLTTQVVQAQDLSRIDRTIRKEPTYRGKPRYALLVFGPDAATRIWVVHDRNTLYLDRNGNGDLTDADEKIVASADRFSDSEQGEFSFDAGTITDGSLRHHRVNVSASKIDRLADDLPAVKALLAKNPNARGYRVAMELEMPGRTGAAAGGRVDHYTSVADLQGVLQFGETPATAPILQFRGPLKILPFGAHSFIPDRETDFILAVGTPGVGPGSTVYVAYERLIPESAYPELEIAFPNGVSQRVALKQRC